MKVCSKCKEPKEYSAFSKSKNGTHGLQSYCKACQSARQLVVGRTYKYASLYGLTMEEVVKLQAQGCEICGRMERLHIDHCHTTGKVRGCLCHNCNVSLGLLGEDVVRLERAIDYLRKHKCLST